MLDRLVVAYDGSELSREAFAYAVVLASAARVGIHAIHALEPPRSPVLAADAVAGFDPNPVLAQAVLADDAEVERERNRFEDELAELGEYCARQGVPFSFIIQPGFLLHLLPPATGPTDLIAVGMKGRFADAGLGSSTRALVRRSPCPLLVVAGALHPVNRVLAVFDGSDPSRRALAWARDAAARTAWPLTILAVSSPRLPLDEALAAAQAAAPDATVVHYGPDDDDEAVQIERAAEHATYALLVMGAFPDSWLHQLFFGGTTGRVLSRVSAPVVLVH